MMRRILPVAAALLGALVLCALPPTRSAQADSAESPESFDEELRCAQLVPQVMSFENKPSVLRVRILLDGTPKDRAAAAVVAMRRAYAPLEVEIRPSYRRVTFHGDDAKGLLDQAKKLYGGAVPRGIDVVYTVTDKDIAGVTPAGKNVAGLADCIGGVRFPAHAFAVGELFPETVRSQTLPVTIADATGKTMAHEIGHLLGAHHHYGSVEGVTGQEVLTLMGPSLSLIGLRLSTLEAAVVRGHLEHRP